MARRHRGRLAGLLIATALTVAACSATAAAPPSTAPAATTTSLSPETTTTSTTSTSTTTTTVQPTPSTTSGAELPDLGAEVGIPDGDGPFPSVVLVHGGGWVAGDPSIMRALASHLTAAGFLTVNTPYMLANRDPGFPGALDDVACAVRYAAAHPRSDGTVAIVGHSAGAHLAAVVALTGDRYGEDCPVPGRGLPEKLVGLAGPYDVDRLGVLMLPFFGGGPAVEPEAWAAGNPQLLTDENPDLLSLIMYGENDGIVDSSFAFDFDAALRSSGSESLVELVEGARHNDMDDPAFVGDLIVVWLER